MRQLANRKDASPAGLRVRGQRMGAPSTSAQAGRGQRLHNLGERLLGTPQPWAAKADVNRWLTRRQEARQVRRRRGIERLTQEPVSGDIMRRRPIGRTWHDGRTEAVERRLVRQGVDVHITPRLRPQAQQSAPPAIDRRAPRQPFLLARRLRCVSQL